MERVEEIGHVPLPSVTYNFFPCWLGVCNLFSNENRMRKAWWSRKFLRDKYCHKPTLALEGWQVFTLWWFFWGHRPTTPADGSDSSAFLSMRANASVSFDEFMFLHATVVQQHISFLAWVVFSLFKCPLGGDLSSSTPALSLRMAQIWSRGNADTVLAQANEGRLSLTLKSFV